MVLQAGGFKTKERCFKLPLSTGPKPVNRGKSEATPHSLRLPPGKSAGVQPVEKRRLNIRNSCRIAVSDGKRETYTAMPTDARPDHGTRKLPQRGPATQRRSGRALRNTTRSTGDKRDLPEPQERGDASVPGRPSLPAWRMVQATDEYARGSCLSSSERFCGACATATSGRSAS